jgi:hypothetical protein
MAPGACHCDYVLLAPPPFAHPLAGRESYLDNEAVTIPVNGKMGFIEDSSRNPQLLSQKNGALVAVFATGAALDPDRTRYSCIRDAFPRTFKTAMGDYDRHFRCSMAMTCYPNSVVSETWIRVNQVPGQFGHSHQAHQYDSFKFGGQPAELEWLWYGQTPQGPGVSSDAEVVENFVQKVAEWLREKCDANTCQEDTQAFKVFYTSSAPSCMPDSFRDSQMKVEGGGWANEWQRDDLIAAIQDVLRSGAVKKRLDIEDAAGWVDGFFTPAVVAVRICNGGICGTEYSMKWSVTITQTAQDNTCGDVLSDVGAAAGLLNGVAGFAAPWLGGWLCPLVSGSSGANLQEDDAGIIDEEQPRNDSTRVLAPGPPSTLPATSSGTVCDGFFFGGSGSKVWRAMPIVLALVVGGTRWCTILLSPMLFNMMAVVSMTSCFMQ